MVLIRGTIPEELALGVSGDGSGYGSGSGYGYGYGSGYGSGSGSGYGSVAGSGSGSGSGSGDGSGDGSGYGYGDGDGYGDGSGSGSGDGDGYGDGSGGGDQNLVVAARAQLPAKYECDERTFGLWKSNAGGRPSNGGVEVRPAVPGLKQEAVGPLKICTPHALHATLMPSKWKGERLWIVALEGEVMGNAEKMAALKREIICEVKI